MATGDASDRPSIKLGSTFMKAGAYDAVLADADGKELARTAFWVLARDAVPVVRDYITDVQRRYREKELALLRV